MHGEQQVRDIFNSYFDGDKNWTNNRALIRNTFVAMWYAALPVDRVNRIAAAISNYESCDLQVALDELVKAKVLRRFKKHGETLYEVNFKEESPVATRLPTFEEAFGFKKF